MDLNALLWHWQGACWAFTVQSLSASFYGRYRFFGTLGGRNCCVGLLTHQLSCDYWLFLAGFMFMGKQLVIIQFGYFKKTGGGLCFHWRLFISSHLVGRWRNKKIITKFLQTWIYCFLVLKSEYQVMVCLGEQAATNDKTVLIAPGRLATVAAGLPWRFYWQTRLQGASMSVIRGRLLKIDNTLLELLKNQEWSSLYCWQWETAAGSIEQGWIYPFTVFLQPSIIYLMYCLWMGIIKVINWNRNWHIQLSWSILWITGADGKTTNYCFNGRNAETLPLCQQYVVIILDRHCLRKLRILGADTACGTVWFFSLERCASSSLNLSSNFESDSDHLVIHHTMETYGAAEM